MSGARTQAALMPVDQALASYLEGLLTEPGAESPQAVPVSKPIPPPVSAPKPMAAAAAGAALPDWARSDFPVQIIRVAGLTVAVPAARIHSVVMGPTVGPLTLHLPGTLGTLILDSRTVRVVDTAYWLVPPEHRPAPCGVPVAVLVIDGNWGLACDGVLPVETLTPAAIRWRSARTQRRWLAGTVAARGLAILDPTGLTAEIAAAGPV